MPACRLQQQHMPVVITELCDMIGMPANLLLLARCMSLAYCNLTEVRNCSFVNCLLSFVLKYYHNYVAHELSFRRVSPVYLCSWRIGYFHCTKLKFVLCHHSTNLMILGTKTIVKSGDMADMRQMPNSYLINSEELLQNLFYFKSFLDLNHM